MRRIPMDAFVTVLQEDLFASFRIQYPVRSFVPARPADRYRNAVHLRIVLESYASTVPAVRRSRRANRKCTGAEHRIAMPARAIAGRTTSNFCLRSNGR